MAGRAYEKKAEAGEEREQRSSNDRAETRPPDRQARTCRRWLFWTGGMSGPWTPHDCLLPVEIILLFMLDGLSVLVVHESSKKNITKVVHFKLKTPYYEYPSLFDPTVSFQCVQHRSRINLISLKGELCSFGGKKKSNSELKNSQSILTRQYYKHRKVFIFSITE